MNFLFQTLLIRKLYLAGVLLSLFVGCFANGCFASLIKPSIVKQDFLIIANYPEEKPKRKEFSFYGGLRVRRFSLSNPYLGKELVYRKSEFRYESDFYNKFLVSPADNLRSQTRFWLERSGLFQNIISTSSHIAECWILEGSVNELYGDYRNKAKAVIQIHFFLMSKGGDVFFEKKYTEKLKLQKKKPHNLIEAYGKGLANILISLENDIDTSNKKPKQTGCGSKKVP